MKLDVRKKVFGIAVAFALLGLGGIALAADAPRPSLHQTSSDSSDSSESSESTESPAPESSEPDAHSHEHPDNHGAAVSKAAHDCPHEGHGACVSAVARANAGSPKSTDSTESESTESESTESESTESESTESEAPEPPHDAGSDHPSDSTPEPNGGHGS